MGFKLGDDEGKKDGNVKDGLCVGSKVGGFDGNVEGGDGEG